MSSLEPGRFSPTACGNRRSFCFLLVCFAMSVATVVFASHQIAKSKQRYQLAKASVGRVSVEVDRHVGNLMYLRKNKELFFAAMAAGKIGRGEEIQWGEVLLDLSNRVGVTSFTYQMNDSEPLDSLHGVSPTSASVYRTEITLAFEAKHGAEVFKYFELLGQEAPGAYVMDQLRLHRVEPSDTVSTQRVALVTDDGSVGDTSVDEFATYGGVDVKATLYWYQFVPNLVERDASLLPNA